MNGILFVGCELEENGGSCFRATSGLNHRSGWGRGIGPLLLSFLLVFAFSSVAPADPGFLEVADEVGLGVISGGRTRTADIDGDGRSDLMLFPISRKEAIAPIVFRNLDDPESPAGFRFVLLEDTGLPRLMFGDIVVFADIDNDGHKDAIITRYLDYLQEDFSEPIDPPSRSGWMRGDGRGHFGEPRVFGEALPATTSAVALGDVNRDGLPDLWVGNWYEKYFTGVEAFSNDLLLQYRREDASPGFVRWPVPDETLPTDFREDRRGRPTYGAMIALLDDGPLPMLLENNYGRRWNRLYRMTYQAPVLADRGGERDLVSERARENDRLGFERAQVVRGLTGVDIAPSVSFDGDETRHGLHPAWLKDWAKKNPRYAREDEQPFRSNGNTFDAAVGDIDNDGDFDFFVSTIKHAWAGDSSDVSRFFVNLLAETGEFMLENRPELSVDRWPPPPVEGEEESEVHRRQNQGDIFCEFADLDHDGRLDLILCSSDYPDVPPYEERLRLFMQQEDGTFLDRTLEIDIELFGAGQPALADYDGDGDLDFAVSQSFNKINEERKRAAALANGTLTDPKGPIAEARPRYHVFLNEMTGERKSLVLRLRGDPAMGVATDALGAVVRMTADLDGDPSTPPVTQMRQLIGIGGHGGKQHDFIVHFGLGRAVRADRIEISWPGIGIEDTVLKGVPAGTMTVTLGE